MAFDYPWLSSLLPFTLVPVSPGLKPVENSAPFTLPCSPVCQSAFDFTPFPRTCRAEAPTPASFIDSCPAILERAGYCLGYCSWLTPFPQKEVFLHTS